MTLLNTINVGGTDYGITGAAVLGSCATPAGSEVKVCTFSDNFELKAGDMLLVKFTYANTYGDGSTTYPKLQVNGTNYVMRRADGNYLQSGEWGNNATLTFLFDGTDFILPAGSGTGNAGGIPLGTVLAIYTNQVPDGYLPCNGVQFDTAQFAALYALLGDNHTPDLREVTLRGIGRNGTYVFDNTETNPSTGQAGTQSHDEYTLGEFKDDQFQDHKHSITGCDSAGATVYGGCVCNSGPRVGYGDTNHASSTSSSYRTGTVTRGKSVGVNYIIKATSGLPDSQQDYILNTMNTQRSYSTTEHPTGKYWTDGKPIYSKTLDCEVAIAGYTPHNITNIDKITKIEAISTASNGYTRPIPFAYYADINWSCAISVDSTDILIQAGTSFAATHTTASVTIEYTKTTPST